MGLSLVHKKIYQNHILFLYLFSQAISLVGTFCPFRQGNYKYVWTYCHFLNFFAFVVVGFILSFLFCFLFLWLPILVLYLNCFFFFMSVHIVFFFLACFSHGWFFCLFVLAYGSSQAGGQIGAVVANLHHSHSNVRSEIHLWPTLYLMVMPDP